MPAKRHNLYASLLYSCSTLLSSSRLSDFDLMMLKSEVLRCWRRPNRWPNPSGVPSHNFRSNFSGPIFEWLNRDLQWTPIRISCKSVVGIIIIYYLFPVNESMFLPFLYTVHPATMNRCVPITNLEGDICAMAALSPTQRHLKRKNYKITKNWVQKSECQEK